MKAVNLIPAEERRGAGGAAGRTGGGAYILLAALALFVLMFAAYATTKRSINDQQATLTTLERQASAGEARAAALAPYTAFAALRVARVETVHSIADSRFDWAHAMHELGRTLPRDITLTALTGTVSKAAGGSAGGGVALRAAYDTPAIELTGCAPGQSSIPPMLAALRQVDGVRRVALQQSIKSDVTPATTAADGTKTKPADCRRTFQAVVFFDAKPQAGAAAAAAPAAAGATGTAAAALPVAPTASPATGTAQNVNGGAK